MSGAIRFRVGMLKIAGEPVAWPALVEEEIRGGERVTVGAFSFDPGDPEAGRRLMAAAAWVLYGDQADADVVTGGAVQLCGPEWEPSR